jgi:hypothetical protein
MAVSTYRQLLRATRAAFRGDSVALKGKCLSSQRAVLPRGRVGSERAANGGRRCLGACVYVECSRGAASRQKIRAEFVTNASESDPEKLQQVGGSLCCVSFWFSSSSCVFATLNPRAQLYKHGQDVVRIIEKHVLQAHLTNKGTYSE